MVNYASRKAVIKTNIRIYLDSGLVSNLFCYALLPDYEKFLFKIHLTIWSHSLFKELRPLY